MKTSIGPIAASYDELQSLAEIRQAIAEMTAVIEPRQHFLYGLLQSLRLIANTIEALTRLSTLSLQSREWIYAERWYAWIGALSDLQVLLMGQCLVECGSGKGGAHSLSAVAEKAVKPGREALQQLDSVVSELLSNAPQHAVRSALNTIEATAELRVLRTHTQAALSMRELSALSHLGGDLACCFADVPGAECLDRASTKFELEGPTLIQPFRVVHQVPELLGLLALMNIEAILSARVAGADAVRRMSEVRRTAELACLMLIPLRSELNAAEYHVIRENLGKTSGSHSKTLSHRLFSRDFNDLSRWMAGRGENAGDVDAALRAEYYQFRAAVHRWRYEHLHLPRTVLGGFGARSLIGSTDAVAQVEHMLEKQRGKDVFAVSQNAGALAGVWPGEELVLRTIAELTIRRFPDVQDRTGPFGDD